MSISTLNEISSVESYLSRIGAEPRSLRVAIVKEWHGQYFNEAAKIVFSKTGDVKATVGYGPTEDEQALIKADFAKIVWPKWVTVKTLENLPKCIREADPENVFKFYDASGENILMLHLRVDFENGKKTYLPYSFYDDGKWRCAEPETENGLIPLYGLHTLKGNTTAFISEGSKAARAVERLINPKTPEERQIAEDFPWARQFKHVASVGYVGGALAVKRTDWLALKRAGIERVIIIPDNDKFGFDAVPEISDLVDLPANVIQFDEQWPTGFDLADPWPEKMFRTIDDKKFYVGPSYFDVIKPATFMTRLVEVVDEKGKTKHVPILRHHAKNGWWYAEKQQRFVNAEFPNIELSKESLDEVMTSFSHTTNVSKLLLKEYSSRVWKLAYRPDLHNQRRVIVDGELAINLFRGTNLNPKAGDVTPFLDFIHFLVPDKKEAHELLRWIATLVAKPEIRMLYGVLLISEATGIGKTLLCESIVAPLVGMHNVSFPSESTVMEQYTSWIAKKRLAIIGEIYQGHSFKMENKLKQFITDSKVTLREMYETPVTMDNFCHFMANSNSMLALKFSAAERRWFVPKLTETRLSDEQYDKLFDWLRSGGLSIIYHWAENFGDYVRRSEKAPTTIRKQEMIESSRSEASGRIEDLARVMGEKQEPIAFGDKSIRQWLDAVCEEKVYEKPAVIRKDLARFGAIELEAIHLGGDGRLSYNSQMQTVLVNKKAFDKLMEIEDIGTRKETVRQWMTRPGAVMTQEE